MKTSRLLLGLIVACLTLPVILAAPVEETDSGLPGSNAYVFMYDAADTSSTVVRDVAINDFIYIIYGKGSTGLPIRREFRFLTPSGDAWRYEIKDINGGVRQSGLTIKVGEEVNIALGSSPETKLIMTLTGVENRRASFEFTIPGYSLSDMNLSEDLTEPVNGTDEANETEEASANITINVLEQENPVVAEETIPEIVSENEILETEPTAGDEKTGGDSNLPVIIIVGVIVILFIGLFAYFMNKRDAVPSEKPAEKRKSVKNERT